MKSFCIPLLKVIKLVIISVIICMIWSMENHNRFNVPISFTSFVFQIKKLVCMTVNKSKKTCNTISNFFMVKIFNTQIREGKVISFKSAIWQVPYDNSLKINTNGAARVCPHLCDSILKGSQGKYVDNFSTFFRSANICLY